MCSTTRVGHCHTANQAGTFLLEHTMNDTQLHWHNHVQPQMLLLPCVVGHAVLSSCCQMLGSTGIYVGW